MEKRDLYVYRNENASRDAEFKVGVVGIAGRLGARIASVMTRHPNIDVVSGVDISAENVDLRNATLECAGLELDTGVLSVERAFEDCDVILDARCRSRSYPEDLRACKKPVLVQSHGDEVPSKDGACRLLLPVSLGVGDYMRVGDCNLTGLSQVVGSIRHQIDELMFCIFSMNQRSADGMVQQASGIHSIRTVPTAGIRQTCEELFGVPTKVPAYKQTGGPYIYSQTVEVKMSTGFSKEDLLRSVSRAAHTIVLSDPRQNTFDFDDMTECLSLMGNNFPPIVVYSCTDSEERGNVVFEVGIINKTIALACNLDGLNYLMLKKRGLNAPYRAMEITDEVTGWGATVRKYSRQKAALAAK